MTIWFTSDPHWGHRFVAKLRGFDSPEEHDDHLCAVYNGYFEPGDIVWWLGDLTMRMRPQEATNATVLTQPAASHRLIYGNHDAGHPLHSKTHRHREGYAAFDLAEPFAKTKLSDGSEVRLSHFPYEGDGDGRGPARYSEWRLRDHGVPLLHGHTHGEERVTRSPAGTIQVHVGWDAWHRPVASHEIARLILEAPDAPTS